VVVVVVAVVDVDDGDDQECVYRSAVAVVALYAFCG
jgi:hypothetical protein